MNFLRKTAAISLALLLTLFCLWRNDKMAPLTDFASGLIGSAKDLQSTLLGGGIGNGDGGGDNGGGGDGGAVLPPPDTGGNYGDYDPSLPTDEQLFGAIYNGLLAMNETVDLAAISPTREELSAAMASVIYSSPELFYVGSGYSIQLNGDNVVGIKPVYTKTPGEVVLMREVYERELDTIVAAAPIGSDFDKLLYLHDYFVLNYTYDHTLTIRDAYTFFTEKTGVCQAYMLGLIAAAERLGIEAIPVTSDAMMHAWNMVKLDGAWYHVDLTWDDGGSLPNSISYRYFLQSNNGIVAVDSERPADKQHREWAATEVASSTTYDAAAWRYSYAPIAKLNDTYYCTVHSNGTGRTLGYIYHGTDPTAMTQLVAIEGDGWNAGGGTRYVECYSGLLVHGNYLYFNTGNEICRMAVGLGSTARETFHVPNLTGLQSVYGFYGFVGENIEICIATSPRDTAPIRALLSFA